MPQNSLTLCIDETGVYYRVPICLINDPIGYDADYQAQKLKSKKAPDEVQLKLKFRNTSMGDVEMDLSNLVGIADLKKMYVDLLEQKELSKGKIDTSLIRLFAMGKELKDDLFVYSYDIMNESTVQVMIRKVWVCTWLYNPINQFYGIKRQTKQLIGHWTSPFITTNIARALKIQLDKVKEFAPKIKRISSLNKSNE